MTEGMLQENILLLRGLCTLTEETLGHVTKITHAVQRIARVKTGKREKSVARQNECWRIWKRGGGIRPCSRTAPTDTCATRTSSISTGRSSSTLESRRFKALKNLSAGEPNVFPEQRQIAPRLQREDSVSFSVRQATTFFFQVT